MKINTKTLVRTNMAFPSSFKASTTDCQEVLISYRYGVIDVTLDGKLFLSTQKEEFDLGGYLSDEDLMVVLKREELL